MYAELGRRDASPNQAVSSPVIRATYVTFLPKVTSSTMVESQMRKTGLTPTYNNPNETPNEDLPSLSGPLITHAALFSFRGCLYIVHISFASENLRHLQKHTQK
jgi:hypothetical protein